MPENICASLLSCLLQIGKAQELMLMVTQHSVMFKGVLNSAQLHSSFKH